MHAPASPDSLAVVVPAHGPLPLARYDAACRAIAECVRIDEAKEIRNKAEAIRVYARQVNNPQLEADAWAIRKRAERQLGKLSAALDKAQGARTDRLLLTDGKKSKADTLADAGITTSSAHRYEKLAKIPDSEWEALEAKGREQIAAGYSHADAAINAAIKAKARPPKPAPLLDDVKGDPLTILPGDCMARLQEIPDASIDCVITSPPYFRTLVYPGSFTVFGGDACCDQHEWQMQSKNYGGWHQRTTGLNDRHKTKNEEKTVERGTCKKCGAERVMLGWEETVAEYIEHLVQIFAEAKRVLKPRGVFWLNIGDKCTDKHWLNIPERLLLALDDMGWICVAKIVWHIPNKMPSSVTDRPNCDYEHVYMFVTQDDYYFDAESVREPAKCADDPRRGKRVNYYGKYDGTTGFGQQAFVSIRDDGTRGARSVWSIPSDRISKYSHCCPFPRELVRRMILLGCPEGRVALDPFAGSGTVGLVALVLGRKAVLIEANGQFAAEARDRIRDELEEYKAKPFADAAE